MVRKINRLSARTVETTKAPGRHADGGGLYLVVGKGGTRQWVFLFRDRETKRLREMGLGGCRNVTLARAREKAAEAREVLGDGKDPFQERDAASRERGIPSFGAFADQWLAGNEGKWRNAKHRAQWRMTLKIYAAPLRSLPVDAITTEDVLSALTPIWKEKPETASRTQGRIEKILDAAKARGHRTGENPARWRGHLENLLPARQKLTRGHHAAMPVDDVPAFVRRLRQRPALAARALEFTILTAARTSETLNATWAEINLEAKVWTVPASRMKAGKEHRVPLSQRALTILDEVAKFGRDGLVFPGPSADHPLSENAMTALLKRMGSDSVTVHGFRSSFRDWCGERTSFSREVAEAALAHVNGDKAEAAYRRGDALEKRRALMEAWAGFHEPEEPGNVVPLRAAAR